MHHTLVASLLSVLCVLMPACTEPIEPGSDLEDPGPAQELGELVDVALNGNFLLTGTVINRFAPNPIPLSILVNWEKSGDIVQNSATVNTELRDMDAPEMMGFPADAPSPVTLVGSFVVTVSDFPLPVDPSGMAQTGPMMGTITLNARIISEDCVVGKATLTIDGFPFVGDFSAAKVERGNACGEMMAMGGMQ